MVQERPFSGNSLQRLLYLQCCFRNVDSYKEFHSIPLLCYSPKNPRKLILAKSELVPGTVPAAVRACAKNGAATLLAHVIRLKPVD